MDKKQAKARPSSAGAADTETAQNGASFAATGDGRRLQTRRSGVHGKGVFARMDLAEGECLIEYRGEVISWPQALERHPHDPKNPHHTFYFHVDEHNVIDGKQGGNSSRWINHSCAPNCEADAQNGRIFIKALRNIAAGQELFYDYGLVIDARYTQKLLADYPCWCGAHNCRGTLLAAKGKRAAARKPSTNAGLNASLNASPNDNPQVNT